MNYTFQSASSVKFSEKNCKSNIVAIIFRPIDVNIYLLFQPKKTTFFKISVRHNTTVTSLTLWATTTNRVYSQLHYILPLLKNFCEAE